MYVFLDVCQLMLGGLRHTGLKYSSKNIGQRGERGDNGRLSGARIGKTLHYNMGISALYAWRGGGGLTADSKMAVCGWLTSSRAWRSVERKKYVHSRQSADLLVLHPGRTLNMHSKQSPN